MDYKKHEKESNVSNKSCAYSYAEYLNENTDFYKCTHLPYTSAHRDS